MYKDKKVAVVVPACNEERLIGRVIETMPDFVDRIYVVDDRSQDGTRDCVQSYLNQVSSNGRLELIRHTDNRGVGAAIATGYRKAAEAVPVAVRHGDTEPLRLECQHFLDCVRTRSTPLTDGEEGRRVLQVLNACQRSLDQGTGLEEPVLGGPLARAAKFYVHPTAVIDQPCEIGEGTRIWHFTHVMAGARIGRNCVLGQNVMVAPDVVIGDNVKIQNNVSVYTGVVLEDDVFCGPSMVFTNVVNPRSHVSRRHEFKPTVVRRGATIGANATVVCGHEVGG